MFRAFRSLIEAIKGLDARVLGVGCVLEEISRQQRLQGPADERLDELERSRIQFEADVEGLLLKADGKLKAANNSEARERQLKKHNERLFDPLAEDVDVGEAPDRRTDISHHVEPSEEERVHALPLGVAPSNKTDATNSKWGT